MLSVFLSDVHLDPKQPDISAQFLAFLETLPEQTERLYVVGDLFEAWIGDDAPGPLGQAVAKAFAKLSARGISGFFTHGNRDFLLGETFTKHCGFTLLPDAQVIDMYGTKVLLMHGDTLCIDDIEYQKFRAMVRNPDWQKQILALDVEQRLAMAAQLRATSAEQMSLKAEDIVDVNQGEVERVMSEFNVNVLLHGHTHRPDVHRFTNNSEECTRIVLGDWYEHGSAVYWSEQGFQLKQLQRDTTA